MPSRSAAALFALLVLCLGAVATGPATSALVAPATTTDGPSPALENGSAPEVVMVAQIQPDGDARWHVSTTFALRTENDTRAFETLATQFRNGNTDFGVDAFRAASDRASKATGRSMAIRDVAREARTTNETGRLVVSFTWTNFARVEGDRLYVGDAFNTTGGTWLPGLSAGQTLVIRPPSGYGVYGAPVGPDNGTVRWEGETTFGTDGPWVIYTGSQSATSTTTGAGPTTTTTPGQRQRGFPVWGALFVGGLGVVVVAAYVLRGERLRDLAGQPDAESGPDAGSTGQPTVDDPDRPTGPDGVVETSGARTAAERDVSNEATGDDGESAGDDEVIDEELLSDEERIERLLERNGGRMKQANIVKETGWSNAKVSQLLSAMAEDGRVEKLRIGRENLISFPDEDVTDFES